MRSYLPYLVTTGLIALALVIVLNRPDEPSVFGIDADRLRDENKAISRESIQQSLEQWVARFRSGEGEEVAFAGGALLEIETYDLTLNARVRLQGKARHYNEKPLLREIDEITSVVCRTRTTRRLLEAGVTVAIAYENEDGVFIRHHLLRKEACRK